MEHIKINVGNILAIGAVATGFLLLLNASAKVIKQANVPFLSPLSSGYLKGIATN